MKKTRSNEQFRSFEDIFKSEEQIREEYAEKVQILPMDKLFPFECHPYHINDDEEMDELVDSIRNVGIQSPLIVRAVDDEYEILSGHRRYRAAELAGLDKVPAIVREFNDDQACVIMVDSNLSREHISHSEKAFAYKLKMDAIRHQGARFSNHSKTWAADLVGKKTNESGRNVQRYIRLTELTPDLLDLVDQEKIGISTAYEISFLSTGDQKKLYNSMKKFDSKPSISQAQRMKELANANSLTEEKIDEIMSETKKKTVTKIVFTDVELQAYFPKGYTAKQMQEAIIALLEGNKNKKQKKEEFDL